MNISIGDKVGLLVAGESVVGQVTSWDSTTYCFTIVVVKILTGRFAGETAAKPLGELFEPEFACKGESNENQSY
jgi:hypothetical protein